MTATTRSQDISLIEAPPRTDRFYSSNELWYFRTREQGEVGPFRYRSEAQSSLERFLSELQNQLEASR